MSLWTGMKMEIRQPVRVLIYGMLLAILSFGFMVHLLEYQMMTQQVEQAAGYYRPIGRLLAGEKEADISQGALLVDDSEEVLYSSRRYGSFGTLQDSYTPELATATTIQSGNNICYFTGTVISKEQTIFEEPVEFPPWRNTYWTNEYVYYVHVDEVISALPEYLKEGDEIFVYLYTNGEEEWQRQFDQTVAGDTYLFNTTALLKGNSKIGSINYVFFMEPRYNEMAMCKPDFSDVTEERRHEIEHDMARQEKNLHGVSVQSLTDAVSNDYAMGMYRLMEGRWITREDEENDRQVCVVHQAMADIRGYDIGDEITIELYDMSILIWSGILSPFTVGEENYENWDATEKVTRTYEIVGICSYTHARASLGASVVFVPSSSIPQEWSERWKETRPLISGNYYFVLKHPELEDTFLGKYESDLMDLGYLIGFEDRGWEKFQESAQPMLHSTYFGMIIFGVLMVATMILMIIMIVLSKSQEMAIMRALGCTKHKVCISVFFPLFILGVIGTGLGSGVAWMYVNHQAEVLLEGLISLIAADMTLNISFRYLVSEVCIIQLCWSIFLLIMICLRQRRPVLDQIQGGRRNRR